MAPRDRAQRLADARAILAAGGDAWLATAGAGEPHLVPLSMAWDEARGEAVFCMPRDSITVRNVAASPAVRVAAGTSRDVVLIRGAARIEGGPDTDPDTTAVFAARTDWDPSGEVGYVFVRVVPDVVDAWRDADEITGRRIMRHGRWLAP